jgi:predicted acyltransferase
VRVRALDVFRGLTVAGMVIVNNPGDWNTVYAPLLHAEWNGWTPTDLIFPFFLFIVGAAIPFGRVTSAPWAVIVRRAAVIVGCGLLLAGFPFFRVATWRIPGVLQRIAIGYLAAGAIVRATRADRPAQWASRVLAVAAVLVAVHWALLVLVPVPGGVAGDLTEGHDLGAWIDRTVFGRHLYRATWDPEGLLSTVPAVTTTLLGVLAGWELQRSSSPRSLVRRLSGAGLAAVVAGLLWHTTFPINKNLWTGSYVLFTGGLAAAALAACYWWADVNPPRWRRLIAEPFVALGRNALVLFVVSGLVAKTLIYVKWPAPDISLGQWLYVTMFAPLAAPKVASLLYALVNLAVLFALVWAMHRRRWYVTA